MTVSKALLVRVEARPGKEAEVEQFLRGALPIVQGEPDTMPWFAVRMDERTFGIFDAFPNDAARQAHLAGGVGQALMARADELFVRPPQIEPLDVLASKLPD